MSLDSGNKKDGINGDVKESLEKRHNLVKEKESSSITLIFVIDGQL